MLGGGVIGCEFASVWKSFGSDVTIVEALPRLVAAEDEASSKALERAFRKRKIAFRTGTPFQSVKTTDTGVAVTVEGGDVIEAEVLLVAVGRGRRPTATSSTSASITLSPSLPTTVMATPLSVTSRLL